MNATIKQAGGVASLAGKVALVTGANAGIGLASAQAMALAGAYVYVTGRNPDRGANTVAGIEAAGGKASFLRLDVTIEAEWAQATAAVRDRFGRLDILFNNAGNLVYAPVEEMPLETIWYLARLNLEGVFLGMTYAWPLMKDFRRYHHEYGGRWLSRGRHGLSRLERRRAWFEQSWSDRRAAPWHQDCFNPSRVHLDSGHGAGDRLYERGIR